ncbi:MAG TPA: zf-HC2 domain-containing protein [Gemmatimonadales bacterium]|nr:zf-HC2 domain-containing protein [Gemmatimonadales bacterium]
MIHEHALTLLGAYADDELPPEMRREVEAHLTECGRCVQELRVHMALRQRLQAEKGVLEPSDALMRLEAYVARLGRDAREQRASAVPIGPGKRSRLRHPLAAWGGWLVAASLAAVWALGPRRAPGQGMAGMSMGPLTPVAVDSIPESIADAALHDFKRVASEALPQGPELTAVESQVPFSVPALTAPHMRLLGAWTTTIDGVPAAALAYRCHDRLVVQYVVAEHVFFRPPRVRQAIAASGLYAAGEGKLHAVGWPGRDNGSFLVGEFTAPELAAMRD